MSAPLSSEKDSLLIEHLALTTLDETRTFEKTFFLTPKQSDYFKFWDFAYLQGLPKMSQLVERYGETIMKIGIDTLLRILRRRMKDIKFMDDFEIYLCATDLLDKALEKNIKMDEIVAFTYQIPKNTYGAIYGALSQQRLFEFLELYLEKRKEMYKNYLCWKEDNKRLAEKNEWRRVQEAMTDEDKQKINQMMKEGTIRLKTAFSANI